MVLIPCLSDLALLNPVEVSWVTRSPSLRNLLLLGMFLCRHAFGSSHLRNAVMMKIWMDLSLYLLNLALYSQIEASWVSMEVTRDAEPGVSFSLPLRPSDD